MGVTMTMPEGHAIWDCGAALDCIGEVAAYSSLRLEKHVAVRLWTKFNVSNLEVTAILLKRHLAATLPVQIGDAKTWIEAFVVPGSTPHLISRRWLPQHRCAVNF